MQYKPYIVLRFTDINSQLCAHSRMAVPISLKLWLELIPCHQLAIIVPIKVLTSAILCDFPDCKTLSLVSTRTRKLQRSLQSLRFNVL